MTSSDDGIVGFLFYVLIVYPVIAWLLKSYKSGNRGLFLAIGFLSLIAAGKTYMDVVERGPNYYSIMYAGPKEGAEEIRVTRSSTSAEIRKAWKRKSLELHPDKNPSASANAEFELVKEAYDVLINQEQRELYNKFGKEGLQKNFVDANALLLQIGVFYLTWGMLAYILTLGKSSSTARNWIFTGQIVMLVVEVSLVLQEVTLPEWFLPTVTEHEVVWLMHTLFPAFMNGCRSIGSYYYVDVDELTRTTLLNIRASHTEILEQLKAIQDQIDSGGFAGKSATKRPITDKVKVLSSDVGSTGLAPQNTGQAKSGSMGLYVMIIGYVLYYTWSQ
mmetsp:Transcript_54593/g.108345  ORF Transcript_54593/g.108345 Transcript_54593/m.108345 type:complete len:332 (+) Transcript_54593:26-1021(+)